MNINKGQWSVVSGQWKAILALSVAMILSVATYGQAPTPIPSPQDIVTNLPSSSFTNATFELQIGTRANNLNVENIIAGRFNITQKFFVGAEIQNGPASTVIDLAGVSIGVRKPWDAAEVYGMVGGRRNWITPSNGGKPAWEVTAGGGAAWRPVNNGVLSRAALFGEGLGVWSQNSRRGGLEIRGGLTFAL